MFNRSAARPLGAACFVGIVSSLSLLGCSRSLEPVTPEARVGARPAARVVVSLEQPCSLAPGGARMGRPDRAGAGGHTLPAGRYAPSFQDERGIFFASPNGVVVAEAAATGARALSGGIYLPKDGSTAAEEYLGDADRVTQRYRLPEHCRYSIENAPAPATPG